jgi:hypothetical protein
VLEFGFRSEIISVHAEGSGSLFLSPEIPSEGCSLSFWEKETAEKRMKAAVVIRFGKDE